MMGVVATTVAQVRVRPARPAGNPDVARHRQRNMARLLLVMTLLTAPLAGCLVDQHPDADTAIQPQPFTFHVLTANGAVASIAALAWLPESPHAALLLLHGASGVKENYWGDLGVHDYSTGAWHAAQGRAVFAIDRPGYGQSKLPASELTSVEDEAFMIDQVAQMIRTATGHPVALPLAALGVSMGAFMATVTQGLHQSFDAIAPLAWAHHAISDDAKACLRGPINLDGGPCPEPPLDDFHMANADPGVADAVIAGYQEPPAGVLAGFMAWQNLAWAVHGGLEPAADAPSLYDATAARVQVPVLVLIGERDWYIDAAAASGEGNYYGAGATVATVPDTGHMLLHHLNHEAVHLQVHNWLVLFHL